ncbi:MAG TPA: hypothetical protein VNE39_09380 [Planctomycetota bacterium]|nr:hypothetical protein [Planctomycetota bacterium]
MRKPKGDWTDLFLAFRMLLDPRKLWLAFKGVVFSVVLVGVLVVLFACIYSVMGIPIAPPPPQALEVRGGPDSAPAPEEADVVEAITSGRLGDAVRATRGFALGLAAKASDELRAVAWRRDRGPLERVMALWTCQALATLVALGLLAGFVLLFVWSYYGAAIMRLAGVEYALGERIELSSATAYTRRKHQSFYGPPLGLAVGVLVVGLLVLLMGLVSWNLLVVLGAFVGVLAAGVGASVVRNRTRSAAKGAAFGLAGLAGLAGALALVAWLGWRVPYVGEVVLGLLSPLALVAGFVIVLLCVWLLFGMPLMAAVVATGNVGAFEAWSRSFHYLFMHPWRYALYCLVGLAHGAACLAFVHLVRLGVEGVAFLPLSAGAILLGGHACEPLLVFFLWVDHLLLDLVFLAFVAGYLFTSHTILYMLLRQRADGTPITEVHLEPRDQERVLPAPPPQA